MDDQSYDQTIELSHCSEQSSRSRRWSYRKSVLDHPYDLKQNQHSIQTSLQVPSTRLRSNSCDDEHKPLLHSNSGSINGSITKTAAVRQRHVHFSDSNDNQQEAKGSQLPHKDYDSLDYDICYNVPYKEMIKKYSRWTYVHMEVMRWVLVGTIGVITGIVAFIISIIDKYLYQFKLSIFEKYLATEDGIIYGFLALLIFNIFAVVLASLLIVIEPVAAGSGIREVRCYLNGIKVLRVTRAVTLFSKTFGVLLSLAAGLFVGKEGPMIHSGTIIGVGFSQFRSMLFKLKFPYNYFRTDRDKRDFASCGAAAGVAAAFGAPIGGVLFSLEEGSSFWNQALTWRTLFCSSCAAFTLNLFLSLSNGEEFGFLSLGSPGLVDFGTFGTDANRRWNAYHLIIFMMMGACGGLLGALFNSLNVNLTKYRMKYLHRRHRIWRVPEAILIAIVTTVCIYLVTIILGTCEKFSDVKETCSTETNFRNETRDYLCPDDEYYNDMATLMFNSHETVIKQLFHHNGAFSLSTLWIFFLFHFLITSWTYGAGISGGAFTPSLVIGAAFGRFLATVFGYLSLWQPHYFGFLTNIYPGIYSLVGAVSFLGGVKRMILCFTVILIECTNETSLGLPILLSLMIAKFVGDRFSVGLNNRQIALREIPFLGWESPERLDRLLAADVMNCENLCYVYPITRVQSVERLLRTTAYSAFLVVTPVEPEHVPERPKNVQDTHTPQLYRRPSIRGEWRVTEKSETDSHESGCSMSSEILATSSGRERQKQSKSLSINNRGSASFKVESQSVTHTYTEEMEEVDGRPRKLLMFHGIILRSQLTVLLKNKAFFDESDDPESQKRISHSELTASYPRYPDVFDAMKDYTPEERLKLMDLSLYMNSSPYTISHEAPLPQVFNLFRTMGLRHLPVMQEPGIVVGIITRHDLTQAKLREKYRQKKIRQANETGHSLSISTPFILFGNQ